MISNVKMLKNHLYQFETAIASIGQVTVKALVFKNSGTYWEPPHSETEIHSVTQNGIEIELSESQLETLEQSAELAYFEAMAGDEPDFGPN